MRGTVFARPLLASSVSFAIGVALSPRSFAALAAWVVVIVLTASCLLYRRPISAVFLLLMFLCSGALAAWLPAVPGETIRAAAGIDQRGEAILEGVVIRAPRDRTGATVITLEVVAAGPHPKATLVPASGRIEITLAGRFAGRCQPQDRVRIWANVWPLEEALLPEGPSPKENAARRGVALAGRSRLPCVLLGRAPGGSPQLFFERLRSLLHSVISGRLDGPPEAVVRAFATGDQAGIDRATQAAFRAAGLSHLLAVSGSNLALFVGGVFVILRLVFLRIPRAALGVGASRLAALAAAPLAAAYALLTGTAPSCVRAAVMMVVLLLGRVLSRGGDAPNTLAVSALFILAWDPLMLDDPGFQLSVAALASLLILQPLLVARVAPGLSSWPWVVRWPLEVALASAAASLGTAPIVAHHFQRLSLMGVVANVPAAPLCSLILVPLSAFGAGLAAAAPVLGQPLLWIAGLAARLLIELAHLSAAVPYAEVAVPPPNALETAAYFGFLIGFLGRWRSRRGRWLGWICAVVLGLSCLSHPLLLLLRRDLEVAFLPVGQGDATVIEAPGGRVIVVDTGPRVEGGESAARRVIGPYLRKRWIRRIDLLVLTHPHVDHSGGLPDLVKDFEVREVWWNGDLREGDAAATRALEGLPARVVTSTSPERAFGELRVAVLGPVVGQGPAKTVNDASVVLSLRLGRRSFLLTGDAGLPAEAEMLAVHPEQLRADVLKVGHHGSAGSTGDAFLAAVQPRHAIGLLSARNRYGFPHPATVDRLARRGIMFWRTDIDGLVRCVTDGESLEVRGFRPRGSTFEPRSASD